MPEQVVIQSIAATTYALRHAVLWPAQPAAYVQLPDDAAGTSAPSWATIW